MLSFASVLTNSLIQKADIIANGYTQPCLDFIAKALEPETRDLLLKMLTMSGHGPNQLGNFEQCLQTSGAQYYLATITNTQGSVFAGICFTDQCTTNDILQLSQVLGDYEFASVIKPLEMLGSMGLGGWATILFLIFLTLLVALASLFSVYSSTKPHRQQQQSRLVSYFDCFSLQQSLKCFRKSSGEIKFLNGLRSVCFLTVIFGHQLLLRFQTMSNIGSLDRFMSNIYSTICLSYMFSVDVFFYLGGFMVGFLFLKLYNRGPEKGSLYFLKACMLRLLRFWPLYIVVTFLYWFVFPYIGTGPNYFKYAQLVQICKNTWWRDLLFIGNYSQDMCMVWTWYLQVDFQLFVVSLILLYAYTRPSRKSLVFYFQAAVTLGASIYCFMRCQIQKYHVLGGLGIDAGPNQNDSFLDIYNKPWSRVGPYFLGLSMGIYYYNFSISKTPNQFLLYKMVQKRWFRFVIIAIGLGLCLFYMFSPLNLTRQQAWSQLSNSLYLSTGHFMFTLGVCAFTLPALLGFGGPIKTFLEANIFQIMSKLTFSSYLIHYAILIAFTLGVRQTQYVFPLKTISHGVGDSILIMVVGFLLTIIVELPFASIVGLLTGKKKQVSNSKV